MNLTTAPDRPQYNLQVLPFLIACAGQTLELQDAQNYAYTGAMTLPRVETATGVDVEICWDDLAKDLSCHDLDGAEDIDLLALIRFPHLSSSEVEDGIESDDLTQSQLDGYVALETDGQRCGRLVDFDFFGTPIDVPSEYTDQGGTYLLMLSTGLEPGRGARMLSFLEPSADSDVTRVDLGDGCGLLDFEADIATNTLSIEPDGPWTVDWSALTKNGAGNDFEPSFVDTVTVAFYEGLEPDALEASFLDLDLIATQRFSLPLTEVRSFIALEDATDHTGTAFGGVGGDGTWLLALRCGTCANPAPLFLSVLEPGE